MGVVAIEDQRVGRFCGSCGGHNAKGRNIQATIIPVKLSR